MTLGTPLSPNATRVLLLGSGELGKELTIELQRFGVEVIACDKYANAPAMQVAHRAHVFNMLDGDALRRIVEEEHPSLIIPEVEAIATPTLVELEKEGYHVIPTAKAAFLTMNREAIRRLAAEELGLPTARYAFADDHEQFLAAIEEIGIPCVVKPIMSSSGHGQSTVRTAEDVERAWEISQSGGRAGAGRVIVEGFVHFDYEITLLTVRSVSGTMCLPPIGHQQVDGDYRVSWQPQAMSDVALEKAQDIAHRITDALGGHGIFGVEMFICGKDVIFSEVSPRPHDTGMVTMISQNLSEFALHARAVLGLPIPDLYCYAPAVSRALVVEGDTNRITFDGIDEALAIPTVQVRLFGKPEVHDHRRLGVVLATGNTLEEAMNRSEEALGKIRVNLLPRE